MPLTIVARDAADAIAKSAERPASASKTTVRPLLVVATIGAAGMLAGCAQQPGPQYAAHSKEYFPSSIYGPASPRVVADGEPVPRGGGKYLVGQPYTIAGRTYYPSEKQYASVGMASWYGDAFHGRRTANGEIFDRDSISAAHPTMPLPSYARVTNLRNNYSMVVRVNDRGPYAPGRIMDVSKRVADALQFRHLGTTKVKVEYLGGASLAGSDDQKLLATLRIDGGPAQFDRSRPPTMVAESQPQPVQTAAAVDPVPPPPPPPYPPIRDEVPAAAAPMPAERMVLASAPLPPTRPFDLGTIPGAAVPIGARSTSSR